ncbi:DUF4145 domain-containing protein [Orrella marina]|uniref:DUF4145 domain-containing protein n=1 Tax=Orrella marina TaxID=2163011 RepID=A0A2R4XJM1_9BURK|nr:DUF4145 domain-containing protein [Orrella marina]AWB33964.1 hypothetical protein DBV39_09855 [Orrella marina]
MELWKNCWNCGHDTPQERVALEFFPRILEMFSKKDDGKVNQRAWSVFYDSYLFAKCRKCSAPSLFVDEYWTQTTSTEESKLISEEVKANGVSKSGNLVHSLNYPAFSKNPFPQWTHDLEETYMVLFWEVYQATALGLNSLAMMGIRTIVDKYASDKIGDIGGFEKKLNALLESKIVSSDQHALLKVVVDAGSASAHRGYKPSNKHLKSCLQIIEHLISVEKFGDVINEIKQATPKRTHNN